SLTADYTGTLVESFENATVFNNDFIILDPTGGQKFQRTTSAAATGSACIELRNVLTPISGEKDELITPSYDLSTVSNPVLKFKIAFKRSASTDVDKLLVYWSTNCGKTWSLKMPLGGNSLITSSGYSGGFWTPSSSEWVEKSL